MWKAIPQANDPVISSTLNRSTAHTPRWLWTGPKKILPAVDESCANATALSGPVPTMASQETRT
ncbi:Uncharacterised protein [Mycobacteroides abscessus subsp. abscessus]|nr:Uncharacterised protein [Mycobacteroides abscessus subsp. abscessus]